MDLATHIPTKFSYIITRIALALLRGLRVIGLGFVRLIGLLGPVTRPIARFFVRKFLLPLYRTFIIIRLRVAKWMVSARGFIFLLFTNRYVFHAVIVVISLATIGSQVQAKYATASEVGQHSLLYSLVSDQTEQVVEESAEPHTMTKNTNYLGGDTIVSAPSIDYDYEMNGDQLADLTVPGSIAYQPGTDQIGSDGQDGSDTTPTRIERTKTETYVVQSGDTVASIARRFSVNVGTVIWANNLGTRAFIKPGLELKIPPISGLLLTIKSGDTIEKLAKKYQADAEEIYSVNHLNKNHALAVGDELVIPGGIPPETPSVPTRTTVAVRVDVPKTNIKNKSYDIYQELTKTNTDTRTKPPDVIPPIAKEKGDDTVSKVVTTKLLWPTHLHVINQYYGWKHTGVDIDGDYTDPMYASADGVVEQAGWNNGGYGLMILIDHKNGLKTRYGHASKLFVSPGDTVKRGQVIAMVGTTGRSTGTHLHFEVYSNGKRQNPLAYIR